MTITAHNLINAPAHTTLAAGITDSATSFTVADSLAVAAPFKASIGSEIVNVGAISGTAWSDITRGAEGTTAASHSSNDAASLRITAGHFLERRPFNVYPAATNALNEANIQAAIDEGYVSLAPGTYTVGSAASSGAIFTRSIGTPYNLDFNGNGATITLATTTPNTVDLFYFTAPDAAFNGYINFHDVTLLPETDLTGRYAIHFDTTGNTTYGFNRVNIERVRFGSGSTPTNYIEFGNHAAHVTNPDSTNGFAYAMFRDIRMFGGMYFEDLGDSVFFENVLANGTEHVAFDIPSVRSGAGDVRFIGCTAVCQKGALRAVNVPSLKLDGCNFEHSYGTAPTYGAVVYLNGCNRPFITDTRSARVAGTAEMHGLHAVGCTGLTVTNCLLGGYGASKEDFIVDATSTLTYPPTAAQALAGNYCYRNDATYISIGGTTRAAI